MARPYGASPTPLSLVLPPLSLSASPLLQSTESKRLVVQQSRLSFAPPATQISPARYRAGARVGFFVSFLLKILKPAARSRTTTLLLGCWSRGEHLLRDRFKSARARAPTRIKPLRSIRLRRINRKSNNSPLVADVDSIMFARAACF